jgi:hypothetical protein
MTLNRINAYPAYYFLKQENQEIKHYFVLCFLAKLSKIKLFGETFLFSYWLKICNELRKCVYLSSGQKYLV